MRVPLLFPALLLASCSSAQPARDPPPVAFVAAPASAPVSPKARPPPAPPIPEERRMPSPEYLPTEARILLSDRMQMHGFDMTNLLWAILFLDHGVVADIAGSIGAGPWIAEPDRAELDDLNARLPARFFELQSELTDRARSLASAARAKPANDKAIATAFGRLAETCVRCHSTYLYGDEAEDILGQFAP